MIARTIALAGHVERFELPRAARPEGLAAAARSAACDRQRPRKLDRIRSPSALCRTCASSASGWNWVAKIGLLRCAIASTSLRLDQATTSNPRGTPLARRALPGMTDRRPILTLGMHRRRNPVPIVRDIQAGPAGVWGGDSRKEQRIMRAFMICSLGALPASCAEKMVGGPRSSYLPSSF